MEERQHSGRLPTEASVYDVISRGKAEYLKINPVKLQEFIEQSSVVTWVKSACTPWCASREKPIPH